MIGFLKRVWFPLLCFGLGVLCAWLLLGGSARSSGATPADLAPAYLQDYLVLVADSYAQSRNLPLARVRLEGLNSATVQRELNDLVQKLQQQNTPAQANNVRDLARALQENPSVAATAAPIATAAATRPPAPTPPPSSSAVNEPSFLARLGGALLPASVILLLVALAAGLLWALRQYRLRRRQQAAPVAGAAAQEAAPAPRRSSMRNNVPPVIPLDVPTELRYSAEIADFRQDLRILDAAKNGIGGVGLHVSQIPPPDPITHAPGGLELSLFDRLDRRTRKVILVSAKAAADPTMAELVNRLAPDWHKPAVDVENALAPIILETAYLRLTAEVHQSDFRPGALNPTFRTLVLMVTVTPNSAGGAPPPPGDDDEEEDDIAGATSVATPPRAS